MTERNQSQSLRRALALLAHVRDRTGDGVSSTALAADLGMDKSTVLRLATPLIDAGLLDRDPETGRYRLGLGALQLGQAYLAALDLRTAARIPLRELRERTGETTHLVIYENGEVVYVDKLDSDGATQMASRIGSRMPAYRTAVGRSILAWLPAPQTDAVLAGPLPAATEYTITDPERLRTELDSVRRRGYAIDDRENEPEVRCVAAPIFDHQDQIAGAVSVSGLLSRIPLDRAHDLGPYVAFIGREISTTLGATVK